MPRQSPDKLDPRPDKQSVLADPKAQCMLEFRPSLGLMGIHPFDMAGCPADQRQRRRKGM